MSELKPIPYDGMKPYIFVSYAHNDSDLVWAMIYELQERGYCIWYDDGIHPGTEWDIVIEKHIESASCLICFITDNYWASKNCLDELKYAVDLDKEMILVYLKECEIPSGTGLKMRIGRKQNIHKVNFDSEQAFMERLCLADCIKNSLIRNDDVSGNHLNRSEKRQAGPDKNLGKLIEQVYDTSTKYRDAINDDDDPETINGYLVMILQNMKRVYLLSEKYRYSNPNLSMKAAELVELWNLYVRNYKAFVSIPISERQKTDAIILADKADTAFQNFIDGLIKYYPAYNLKNEDDKAELHKLVKRIYDFCAQYRDGINHSDEKKINDSIESIVQCMRSLYILSEKNRYNNPNLSKEVSELVDLWNAHVDALKIFTDIPLFERQDTEAKRVENKVNESFDEFQLGLIKYIDIE